MQVPFWLVVLASGWVTLALAAAAAVAWTARFGPTEEEALAATESPRRTEGAESPAAQPAGAST